MKIKQGESGLDSLVDEGLYSAGKLMKLEHRTNACVDKSSKRSGLMAN